ncbi:MAG: TIGR02206 family membrane protein [Acidobacteriota bacterium]|nr:TIGR02206 family membrane protein [Acidobacteriota bacterium]
MQLFGPIHLALLTAIVAVAVLLAWLCRARPAAARFVRIGLGAGLAVNELIWWTFRYSHEGFRFPLNLPLQLCDMTLWAAVIACLTLAPVVLEFAYFAGIAGAGMALLTPDLWTPWPSYPAVYFFFVHGGIVAAPIILVGGQIVRLRDGAVWRAYGILFVYAVCLGGFNAAFHTNYMYLCARPANASPLDSFGAWPRYLFVTAVVALGLFWLLWLPVRHSAAARRPDVQLGA